MSQCLRTLPTELHHTRVKRLGEGRHDRPGLGLIKKVQHEDDGRYFKLTLTAKGKKMVEKIKQKSRYLK